MNISYENVSLEDFKDLRKSVNWPLPPDESIETSLKNSVFSVKIEVEDQVIAMGRIIGDHAFVFFIADIIVKPAYQGKGLGRLIMEEIMKYLKEQAPENSYITLMAAKGKEAFYERFGFFKRPDHRFGHGMMIELN